MSCTSGEKRLVRVRCREGFTLLEVMVALAIVGVAIVSILQLFSSNLRSITASEDYLNATLKAESRMQELMSDEALVPSTWTETSNDGYFMEVTVTEVLNDRANRVILRLLQVDLVIRWNTGSKSRSLSLKSMKLRGFEQPPAKGGQA